MTPAVAQHSLMTRALLLVVVVVILTAGGIYLLTDSFRGTSAPGGATVTFNRDIAPIVYRSCIVCHRPGESAPFSLLTYTEARKRAGLITALTTSRVMPPWLPARGGIEFLGERGLSDEEIALIRLWVEQGAAEGDAADLPPLPEFTRGWQLGEPDLILTMEDAFSVPAEGFDVYRNFVLPIPVSTPRWVKAVELRPGNPRVVHHAVMQVDRSRSSRRRDEEDAGPGFSGMDLAGSEAPGGQSLGWTPGKLPIVDERFAWRLGTGQRHGPAVAYAALRQARAGGAEDRSLLHRPTTHQAGILAADAQRQHRHPRWGWRLRYRGFTHAAGGGGNSGDLSPCTLPGQKHRGLRHPARWPQAMAYQHPEMGFQLAG